MVVGENGVYAGIVGSRWEISRRVAEGAERQRLERAGLKLFTVGGSAGSKLPDLERTQAFAVQSFATEIPGPA